MTSDNSDHRDQLEKLNSPAVVVHDGAFVYANRDFLDLLGLSELNELPSPLFLDLFDAQDRERARLFLTDSLELPSSEGRYTESQFQIQTDDETPVKVTASGLRTRFEGEECLQVTFRRAVRQSVVERVRRLPWRLYLSVGFVVLFTLLPSALLVNLQVNNVPTVYFPADEPAVVIDDALRSRFPSDQVFVLLFEGVALYSEGFLKALDELETEVRALDDVDDVLSLTRLDNIRGSADGFEVVPLLDPKRLDESRWTEKKEKATTDRFARHLLVAPDGSAIALVVVPVTIDDSFRRLALYNDVLNKVEKTRLDGYLSAVAGHMAVDVEQLRSMLHDNMLFIPLTMVIGLMLVWLLFRRVIAVVIAGVSIGVVTNSTVALFAILGKPYTLTSTIIAPLLSALTIAALIHLFNALQYASQRGYAGKERVKRAVKEVRRPAFFVAVTTAVGLASLGTSPVVPTALLGLFSAGGVMLIYVVVMMVSPTFIVRWDHKPWPRTRYGLRWMDAMVRVLSGNAARRPVVVLSAFVLVLAGGATQLWNIVVESNIQRFFLPDHPVRVSTDRIDEKLVGTNTLDIVFEAEGKDGLLEPSVLREIKAFQSWVEALPQVDKATSLLDFIEEMHWGFHEEDAAYRTIPDDRRLISQYLLVYDGDDLWDFVDRSLELARMPLNVNVHSTDATSAVLEQIRTYFAEHFPSGSGVKPDIAGHGRLLADMEDLIITGQVRSLFVALALIMLLMVIEWRSLRDAAICMVPNLSPILLIFILMGALGIWLDFATAMIASVAVGIAVDDTIHLYHGFISRYRRHGNTVFALARAYRQAGRAVTTTTLVLCAQFLVLMTSDFVPTANFGMLTSVGLLTAWLFDMLLLPAVLVLVFRGKKDGRPQVAEAV